MNTNKNNDLSRKLAALAKQQSDMMKLIRAQEPNKKLGETTEEPVDELDDGVEESDELGEELDLENKETTNISELFKDDDDDEEGDNLELSNTSDSPENSETEDSVSYGQISLEDVYEKLETLETNFKKFQAKSISILEAILSTNKISIGLSKEEMPRKEVQIKKEGTLNTAIGSFKKEIEALVLKLNEDNTLKITTNHTTIKHGIACESELIINGKIPMGDWIVVENKKGYFLVSVENFEDAEDVTPYSDEEKGSKENSKKGIVINKKGIANNVRGYVLQAEDDCFRLTDSSLKKPYKVFKAKWNRDCDNSWPVKGNIPEGKWVIVYSKEDDEYYLVESKNVEAKVSIERTEPETKKKAVKKINKKVVSKKIKKNKK